MPRNRLLASLQSSRRLSFALKTSFTTLITLILVASPSLRWAGDFTYLSALFAPISSVHNFGQWQVFAYEVLYSTISGAIMSAISSLVYTQKPLLLILLFLGLLWINRISIWPSRAKVFASFCYLLGSMFPYLTDGDIVGMQIGMEQFMF